MEKIINVKYEELVSLSSKYKDDASEILKIKDGITEVLNTINSAWSGVDSSNFVTSTNELIKDLDNESKYLDSLNEYFAKSNNIFSTDIDESVNRLNSIGNSYEINR